MGSKTSHLALSLCGIAYNYREGVAKAKKWLVENVFMAFRVARLMDLNSGTLNTEAASLLRSLETNKQKYVRGTVLPSGASTVQRVFKKIEQVGDVLLPYTFSYNKDGKAVDFDHAHMMPQLMSAFQLDEKAKDTVTVWSSTMDGARLTRGVNHMTGGIKAPDKDAIDLLTGLPIVWGANATVQSRGQCFATNIHLVNETKEKCNLFPHSLQTWRSLQRMECYLSKKTLTQLHQSSTAWNAT